MIEPCPECRAGKHSNCDGRTWDERADDYTDCPCASAGHATWETPDGLTWESLAEKGSGQ